MVEAAERCILHSLRGYMKIAGDDFDVIGWFDQYNDKDRKLLLRIWAFGCGEMEIAV